VDLLKVADALIWFGALVVKDSRVAEADNEQFLDLLEDYFDLPGEELKYATVLFGIVSRSLTFAMVIILLFWPSSDWTNDPNTLTRSG
jgi:hypothetical protein